MVYKRKAVLNSNKKVLVIAVHPDDETLGCGGTLLKHKASGDEIYWCITTSMDNSAGFNAKQIAERGRVIQEVSRAYGFKQVKELGLPTMFLDTVPVADIVAGLSALINGIKPDILYLPFKEDIHSDHRIIFDAAFSCTKSFRYPFLKKIAMMETLSETEFSPAVGGLVFTPNIFVDISEFLEKKIAIMNRYISEVGEMPFPRSSGNIEALATMRGATAGCLYAEAFMLLREII